MNKFKTVMDIEEVVESFYGLSSYELEMVDLKIAYEYHNNDNEVIQDITVTAFDGAEMIHDDLLATRKINADDYDVNEHDDQAETKAADLRAHFWELMRA